MRETIEKLIERMNERDVTAARVSYATGIDQSILSKFKSGQRDIGTLTLNNAEKLYEFQKGYDFLKTVGFVNVNDDDIEDYGEELYRGFYEVMTNPAGNGYSVSFVSIREMTVEGNTVYEVMDSWTDEVDIEKDLSELEADILANEMQQENYYFNNYRDAEKYAEYKFNPKTLEMLISEYK